MSGVTIGSEINYTVKSLWTKIKLEKQSQRFCQLEEVFRETQVSLEDEYCEEHYQKTTTRNEENRFVVELPVKYELSTLNLLGASRQRAVRKQFRTNKGSSFFECFSRNNE